MISLTCYHGTSSVRHDHISRSGFALGDFRFHNWLAARGIYFVCNRPLVAMRHAQEAAIEDQAEPVVLEVPIQVPDHDRLVDLTSDAGFQLFTEACKQHRSLLAGFKLGDGTPAEFKTEIERRKRESRELLGSLYSAVRAWQQTGKQLNLDTVAIEILVLATGASVIVALFHEGTTFNSIFADGKYRHRKTGHSGIRTRDHIEVCLVDPALVDYSRIRVVNDEEMGTRTLLGQLVAPPFLPDSDPQ